MNTWKRWAIQKILLILLKLRKKLAFHFLSLSLSFSCYTLPLIMMMQRNTFPDGNIIYIIVMGHCLTYTHLWSNTIVLYTKMNLIYLDTECAIFCIVYNVWLIFLTRHCHKITLWLFVHNWTNLYIFFFSLSLSFFLSVAFSSFS